MRIRNKFIVGASTVVGLGIGSLGLGVANATPTPTPTVHLTAPHNQVSTADTESGANNEADAPGGHQDAPGADVQNGSQSGPDSGGADAGGN